MNPIVKNILAVVAGWITGSVVNLGLINVGSAVMPLEGVDPNDMAALAEAMPTADFKYFIFPFLAHALGTLAGATVTALIAATRKMTFALTIGVLFFFGGIAVNIMIPGPTWFAVADIVLAYIPMGYLGGKLAQRFSAK